MLNLDAAAYSLIRPLLFALTPEVAQRVAELALSRTGIWRALAPVFRVDSPRLATDLCGLKLRNPVGLAAGYDKDCEFLPSMAALGFGYVTGGTVMARPQPGNPKPRVFRYARDQSLINALGFPSLGLERAASTLQRARGDIGRAPMIVSVSGVTVEDIVLCHRRLEPLVDAVEVNISSPNTSGLRVFQERDALADLLGRLNEGRKRPLFVKLPPYSDSEARDAALSLVRVCVERGVDAVTAANSKPAKDGRLAVGAGGLSGRLIFHDLLTMVTDVKAEAGDRLAINACGGVFTGEDARKALQAGATTVQVLTGLIYRGPGVARFINRELLRAVD